jgi:transglutaminase-like putative cysteine protease
MSLPRFLLLLSALATLPARAGDAGVTLSEPPSWVEPTRVDTGRPLREQDAVSGLHVLLSEEQVRVSPEVTERFVRQVRRVASSRGVETGSKLEVKFSNTHDRLRLHGVWRTRDGVRTQLLRAEDVKVIQQEERLDMGIYSDERTALAFLQDVRAGDLLEESWTVEEDHPLFRGHHLDSISLAEQAPVGHFVHRLLAPANLKLHFKTHGAAAAEPTVREVGALREYRWERKDLPTFTGEDGVPADLAVWPHVQVSSFQSWAEVASWGVALQDGLEGSPELTALAGSWRALPTEEARFLAAVRFVQDEVRYLGIELGPNTHQPHAPGQVLAQRFGDCKDKALLLATLLRPLGISAHVALVNSRSQGGVSAQLPSPYAFNHAIVRAQVAGRTEWVDATMTHQRGRLGARSPLPYARALVLAPGTTALESIPLPPSTGPELDAQSVLSVKDDGTGTLAITTRYTRTEADRARSWLASLSAEQLTTRTLDLRRALFPKLAAEGTPRVQDDTDANTITLEEHYKLEDAWAGGGLSVAAPQVSRELALPRRTEGRVHPVEVSYPVHLRVRWEVHADSMLNVAPSEKTVEGPASRLEMSVVPRFGGFTYQVEYRSLEDRVAPDALARHVEAVQEMGSLLGISFATPMGLVSASSTSKDPQLSRNTSLAISGVFLVVVGALVLGIPRRFRQFLRERKARRAVTPRPVRHLREREQGGAVMTVESLDQADQRIRGERCSCGGTFERVPDALQLRHTGSDGRAITVLRVRCTSCRAPQFLSFDVRPN